MSATPRLFKKAKKAASKTSDEPGTSQQSSSARGQVESTEEATVSSSRSWTKEAEQHGKVQREHDVLQSSGAGRPPRVDFYVEIDDAVVVGEKLSAWNRATLSLAAQRLQRVFANDPKVRLAVVTVPSNGENALREWHQSLHQSLQQRILAGTESKVQLADVRACLKELDRKLDR